MHLESRFYRPNPHGNELRDPMIHLLSALTVFPLKVFFHSVVSYPVQGGFSVKVEEDGYRAKPGERVLREFHQGDLVYTDAQGRKAIHENEGADDSVPVPGMGADALIPVDWKI